MSFFEPPPPPPEPPPGPPPPEWIGPPSNELGASFPIELVLAHTGALALFVHSGLAYGRGFEFSVGLRLRMPPDEERDDPMGWHRGRRGLLEDGLRFGIAFADGRKATTLDHRPWWGLEDQDVPDIVLSERAGGGGGTSWNFGFWAWPIPPAGPIAFVTEWPAREIALVRKEIDSAVVREAAGRAVTLWPDDRPGDGAGTWTRYA